MIVTFSTQRHYQVRQGEFSTPSETLAVSATPHIEAAPHTIPERRKRRFFRTCRLPKRQKETSNVLQTSQTLPAHPIPVARRHVGYIAGHRKRRDACDTRKAPRLRDTKLISFTSAVILSGERQMRLERGRRPYFCGVRCLVYQKKLFRKPLIPLSRRTWPTGRSR